MKEQKIQNKKIQIKKYRLQQIKGKESIQITTDEGTKNIKFKKYRSKSTDYKQMKAHIFYRLQQKKAHKI
jgi:hypothetical protein